MAEEIMLPTKEEALRSNIIGREQEVMHYDINITNYQHAIEEIDAGPHDDPDVEKSQQEFRKQLAGMIVTEKRERAKAQLILNALNRQLG